MSTNRAHHNGLLWRLRYWAARPILPEIVRQVVDDMHKMYDEQRPAVSHPPAAPISPLPVTRPISPMRIAALERSGAIPRLPAPKPQRLAPEVRQTILDGVKRSVYSDRETAPIPPGLGKIDHARITSVRVTPVEPAAAQPSAFTQLLGPKEDAWLNSQVQQALIPANVQQEVRAELFNVVPADCSQSAALDATEKVSAILKLRVCEHNEKASS